MDTDEADVDFDDRTELISKEAMCTASPVDSVTGSGESSTYLCVIAPVFGWLKRFNQSKHGCLKN